MHVHLQMLKSIYIILDLEHSRNYTSCVENVE